jgi:hypothetical protein
VRFEECTKIAQLVLSFIVAKNIGDEREDEIDAVYIRVIFLFLVTWKKLAALGPAGCCWSGGVLGLSLGLACLAGSAKLSSRVCCAEWSFNTP